MKIAKSDFDTIFTEKYKLYGAMLYKIAFLYTKNSADAEDILQDVFTKYFLLKKEFSSAEHEKAWFIRTTQNKSIDYTRRKGRSYCDLDICNNYLLNENHTEQAEIHEDILNKLSLLDNKSKTIIVLFYYYDYPVAKIAHTLKISQDAVKKRLQRAREKLKIEMEDYITDE